MGGRWRERAKPEKNNLITELIKAMREHAAIFSILKKFQ